MSHSTMPYKYGKHTREFLGALLFPFQFSFLRFWGVLNKTVIPLTLVGYEMIIARLDFQPFSELAFLELRINNRTPITAGIRAQIIANSALCASLPIYHPYPTRALGIIVKYTHNCWNNARSLIGQSAMAYCASINSWKKIITRLLNQRVIYEFFSCSANTYPAWFISLYNVDRTLRALWLVNRV